MTTIAEARGVLTTWIADWSERRIGYRVVRLRGTGAAIGFAGVRLVESPGFSPGAVLNLYYRLDPDHWHRGYATEASAAVLREAATRFPAVPVVARIAVVNESSSAVARSLGMALTGWQDPGDPMPHRIFRSPDLATEVPVPGPRPRP